MENLNLKDTIYSQYQKSTKLKGLINTFNLINPYTNIQEIYDKIYNLDTANSYGLDIWGKILNFGRVIELVSEDYFGFKSADYEPFNQAPYFNGKKTNFYKLTDEPYRKILKLICARNLTSATLPELNNITKKLYEGRGTCKVERVGVFQLSFTFDFKPEPWEIAILKNENIMPIPNLASYTIIINNN